MIMEEIRKMRNILNQLIEENASYEKTLEVSVALDKLIATYYEQLKHKENETENKSK
ncbi:MAG: Spo0E family sporulation regulatory protein-aspartic acid phosphatase [Hyphomonadaceae bacterium]|nr:Spo0E family sporulation regulatory protein-aspartic acid phosphatase [Clostridia bacterium]